MLLWHPTPLFKEQEGRKVRLCYRHVKNLVEVWWKLIHEL